MEPENATDEQMDAGMQILAKEKLIVLISLTFSIGRHYFIALNKHNTELSLDSNCGLIFMIFCIVVGPLPVGPISFTSRSPNILYSSIIPPER